MIEIYKEHELVQVLTETVKQAPACSLFAIIDGTSRPDGAIYDFFRYAPEADYYPLFLGTDLEECLPHSPYLAQIPLSQTEYFEQASQTRHGVIWFTSTLKMLDQIEFWKNRLYVQAPDTDLMLFRYWSGSIMHRYLFALTEDEQQQFLNPVDKIATPDKESRQWCLRSIQTTQDIAPKGSVDDWLMSNHQLDAFSDQFEQIQIGEIETTLWSLIPEILERAYPPLISQHITAGIKQAKQLSLRSDHALQKFVEFQFRWGENFWSHSEFTETWKAKNTEKSFIETVARLKV